MEPKAQGGRCGLRLTQAQGAELGAKLAGERAHDRHAASRTAEALGMSASWMRTLKRRAAQGDEPKPVGRPPTPEAERARVRALVAEQRGLQGVTAGWRPILEALRKDEPEMSQMLVEQELAGLKREASAREQAEIEAKRVSHEILARDVAWGEDTTHLARLADGSKVEGEVVKDLGTLETVGFKVGRVPSAKDVIALLERIAEERGGWALVWMGDQGSINRDQGLCVRLERERVVHLLSRVHTPTDNAATEHQHLELKGESGLGKGVIVASHAEADARLSAARTTLDEHRLRATKDWRTAAQLARDLPRADAVVDRDVFYAAACSAMDEAERGHKGRRAVLKARREALFAVLARFGLATRHVGKRPRVRPGPAPCNAAQERVECPRACA
jgi:transposase InsO family protein